MVDAARAKRSEAVRDAAEPASEPAADGARPGNAGDGATAQPSERAAEAARPGEHWDDQHASQAPEDLLAIARRSFEAGKLGECMVALEAARSAQGGPDAAHVERQALVVRMHLAAERRDWWKVLGLEQGAAEPAVRAAYKKLAAQVHPDKCACFGAEAAFQALRGAVEAVLGAAEGGFVKAGAQEQQHAWWERWDAEAAGSRKRRREPEPVPQSQEEELHLRSCSLEELRREVAARQAAVLRPEKGSEAAKLTAAQRQLRVRVARNLLNERLAFAQNAPQSRRGGGGFL